MQAETDQDLLDQFNTTGEEMPFQKLTERYAALAGRGDHAECVHDLSQEGASRDDNPGPTL